MGFRRPIFQRVGGPSGRQRPKTVERLAEAVHHAAQPGWRGFQGGGFRRDPGDIARANAGQIAIGHHQRRIAAKANDLATRRLPGSFKNHARAQAQGAARPGRLDEQAVHGAHATAECARRNRADLCDQAVHGFSRGPRRVLRLFTDALTQLRFQSRKRGGPAGAWTAHREDIAVLAGIRAASVQASPPHVLLTLRGLDSRLSTTCRRAHDATHPENADSSRTR